MNVSLIARSRHRHRRADLRKQSLARRDDASHTDVMVLPFKDRQIISLMDYFVQMTTAQLRTALFAEAKSRTSCDRVLKRLERDDYIRRIERPRPIGGGSGGSGVTVWSLGRRGWQMCDKAGRYHVDTRTNYHTLTIAELYVRLREAERNGDLKVNGFQPEPECWLSVDGIELQPDLLVELERPGSGKRLTSWLEIDMNTQRPARLNEKMERYKKAHERIDDEQLARFDGGNFPLVVFVCHDDDRQREIAWLIERRDDDPRLFRAVTLDNFPLNM
jgi:hypothetical protein